MARRCIVLALTAVASFAQVSLGAAPDQQQTPSPEPRLIREVKPRYPLKAHGWSRAEGTVVLRVHVSNLGVPTSVKVVRGAGALADSALAAAQQWRWEPWQLNGLAVGFALEVTVRFFVEGCSANACIAVSLADTIPDAIPGVKVGPDGLALQSVDLMKGGLPQGSSSVAAQCPDTKEWTGKYDNLSYGFSLVIPSPLKGYWNSGRCVPSGNDCVCMQDHGRIIPLAQQSDELDRHIEVYAGHVIEPDSTVHAEMNQRISAIRASSRKGSVAVLKRSQITLAGLPAERAAVRYYDSQLKRLMVEEVLKARGSDAEYMLNMLTVPDAYESDKRIFEAVISSFSVTGATSK